jgi:hypothetical protein
VNEGGDPAWNVADAGRRAHERKAKALSQTQNPAMPAHFVPDLAQSLRKSADPWVAGHNSP